MDFLLEYENTTFSFQDGKEIFSGFSFQVATGDFVYITGPSGAGKSTLLRLTNRFLDPTAGIIRFLGKPLQKYPPAELRTRILYLHQTPVMIDGSVRENLLLPFRFRVNRNLEPPGKEKIRSMLDEFLLHDVEPERNARELSVGQRQRLALIRALLPEPEVLLLDEPTSALDPESRAVVEEKAQLLTKAGGPVVFIIAHQEFEPVHVQPIRLHFTSGKIQRSA